MSVYNYRYTCLSIAIFFSLLHAVAVPASADIPEQGCCIKAVYTCVPVWEGGQGKECETQKLGLPSYRYCTESFADCTYIDWGGYYPYLRSCELADQPGCKVGDSDAGDVYTAMEHSWNPGERCKKEVDKFEKGIIYRCGSGKAIYKLQNEIP